MKDFDVSLIRKVAEWMQSDIASRGEWSAEAGRGKMFGLLLVEGSDALVHRVPSVEYGVLCAYSGQIDGRSDWPGYVPAIYDYLQPDGYFKTHEKVISDLNDSIREAEALLPKGKRTREVEAMKAERKERSQALQRWLFTQFRLAAPQGMTQSVLQVFGDYAMKNGSRQTVPPGGTGECCAPKLLHYANSHGLKPVAVAEFWYGASLKGEIRHHGQFYEPCQAKCMPILGFLAPPDLVYYPFIRQAQKAEIDILYEDEWFVAVNKSAGLLSVPGKRQLPNAETMLRKMMSSRTDAACAEGYPKMVHRLDMDTSGILLAAKTEKAYKLMQRTFAQHCDVRKEYVAVLSRPSASRQQVPTEGMVTLPLSPDFLNRPMQCVDYEKGKEAVTAYRMDDSSLQLPYGGVARVTLWPETGRTHQLRVHCAHPDGLNMPILGDSLYGNTPSERMFLHAQKLVFRHPFTGAEVVIECPSGF